MTNTPCKYCGEHHHYQHELICDNVRQLYPVSLKEDYKPPVKVEDRNLEEEIKMYKNEYLLANAAKTNAILSLQKVTNERDLVINKLKAVKRELWKLKNPNKNYIESVTEGE